MKRLFSIRGLCLTLGVLVLLASLGIWIENWTGKRALATARLRLAQAGETLDFAALLPKPVPEEVNFCAIPPLVGITLDQKQAGFSIATKLEALRKLDWFRAGQASVGGKSVPLLESLSFAGTESGGRKPPPALTTGCTVAQPLDVAKAAGFLRDVAYIDTAANASPAEILASLDRLHPLLKELSDAAPVRPEAVLAPPVVTLLPGTPTVASRECLALLAKAAQALALRSQVASAAGDSVNAMHSILAIRRLVQALEGDPTLIGLIMKGGMAGYEFNSIWSLLAGSTVDAGMLLNLQRELQRQDIMGSALQATRGELVFQVTNLEWLRHHPAERIKVLVPEASLEVLGYEAPWWQKILVEHIPDGWFDHTAANVIQLHAKYLRQPWQTGEGAAIMRNFGDLDRLLGEVHGLTSPHHIVPALSLSMFWGVLRGELYTEAVQRQALLAVVLERHRLVHGKLPAHLADLVPEFLSVVPEDPMDKQPMRYRQERDAFTLWSIGFDLRDDHGVLPDEKAARRIIKPDYKGDWVWKGRK